MKKSIAWIYLLICMLPVICLPAAQDRTERTPVSGTLAVDGGKLYYEIAGEGEWIVLLHDGILHHVVWDAQFPVLAEHYRVVRYDRRGFGKSTPPQAPFSHLDDLKQVFNQLHIDAAIVFGMSGGGALALDFTLQYLEKVKALVLVGAVVSGYAYSRHLRTRGGRIESLADYRDPEKFIRYFGWEDPYEIYPENRKAKKRFFKLLKENPQNVTGAWGYFSRYPQRPALGRLAEIKVPALILAGEFDIPDVHAHSGIIEVGIRQSKREIIPDSGHLIPLEQPGLFNESVRRFLDSLKFYQVLDARGVAEAAQFFQRKREMDPDVVLFEERDMNARGYLLLQAGHTKDAIELFKLNVIAYPGSWNVYDGLGEAYLKDGQRDLALRYYEKSLELNPENTHAKEVIRELKRKEKREKLKKPLAGYNG